MTTKRFTIDMVSRVADFDVEISKVPYVDAETAYHEAPKFMGRPELWLVVQVTDCETGETLISPLG